MRWFYLALVLIATVVAGVTIGYVSQSANQPQPDDTRLEANAVENRKLQYPLAVVVPHHDLVKTQRQALLSELSKDSQPETIIVLSPNHFGVGSAPALTTTRTWQVDNGYIQVMPNDAIINTLLATSVLAEDDTVFDGEHGIKNIIPDIASYFPDSQVIPIMLKQDITPEQTYALVAELEASCARCGVIASVDMSHYQPAAVADIHDIKTLRALSNVDETDIWNVEVDSNASLAGLLRWATLQDLKQFRVANHTNSGTIANDADVETTTHIFGYYAVGEPNVLSDSFTFTFAGDAMFGREIGYQFQANNFQDLFSNWGDRVFWGTDISWLNLEGPVSDQVITQDRQPDDLVFLFSNQTFAALDYLRLTTVGLANNHTYNNGQVGLDTTRTGVEAHDIDWHGHPNQVTDESVVRYSTGDINVSLISVNVLSGSDGMEEVITVEHEVGQFVIVLPHWGNEYQARHSGAQEQLAHAWVNAGADLIIGMHPHVIQDAQVLHNAAGQPVPVFYSLGNFVFDQTFSVPTQQGLLLTGSITADALTIVPVPIQSVRLQPEILRGVGKQAIIDQLCSTIQEYCDNNTITLQLAQ